MGDIIGGSSGAGFISQALGTSNQFNTPSFVRESIATYGTHILSVWMSGVVTPTQGTLNDAWPASEPNAGNLEVTTPGTFASGSVRSDLYEVRPLTTGNGTAVVDPHTGTSGLAWYIGYFEFSSNGTMTFTREAASTAPAPVTLNIARTNNVSTISFGSASSVTYKLFFTNSAGLGAAVSNLAVACPAPSAATGRRSPSRIPRLIRCDSTVFSSSKTRWSARASAEQRTLVLTRHGSILPSSALSRNYAIVGERARPGRRDWRPRQSLSRLPEQTHCSVTRRAAQPPGEGAGWQRPGRACSPFSTAWLQLSLG